jgi:hypothetical protein
MLDSLACPIYNINLMFTIAKRFQPEIPLLSFLNTPIPLVKPITLYKDHISRTNAVCITGNIAILTDLVKFLFREELDDIEMVNSTTAFIKSNLDARRLECGLPGFIFC